MASGFSSSKLQTNLNPIVQIYDALFTKSLQSMSHNWEFVSFSLTYFNKYKKPERRS